MYKPNHLERWARRSALVGGVVWLLLLFTPISDSHESALIERILLLGTLVIVPLGLSLVSMPGEDGATSLLYRLTLIAQPPGAVASIACLFMRPGLAAAVISSIWFTATALIALLGLRRFVRQGLRFVEEVCINAGLVYVSVGGLWLLISRLGIQPLGFGATIVLLTAVHFHFAGFSAPIIAGLTGRTLPLSEAARRTFVLAATGVVCGTPVVAAGISLSPLLSLAGALMISVGMTLLAVTVFLWVLPLIQSFKAQFLLVVSSISSVFAMILACVYAYSLVIEKPIIDIPQMALTHGMLNSFGFALCGLVGWSIEGGRRSPSQVGP